MYFYSNILFKPTHNMYMYLHTKQESIPICKNFHHLQFRTHCTIETFIVLFPCTCFTFVFLIDFAFIDQLNKVIKRICNETNDTAMMFTTRDWKPYGITISGDLLVCLRKDDQSKVVRYSNTGTVLQEIQYDSQCQPLYQVHNRECQRGYHCD